MLQLLRKYQKAVFAVVTVVIITSFLFFGTYSSVQSQRVEPDRVIGTGYDGSLIHQKEIGELVRFLNVDASDASVLEDKGLPNFFNDGVIKRDFFQTGMGQMLLNQYLGDLKEELEERIYRNRKFTPYRHAQGGHISAEKVWKQFMPNMYEDYRKFMDQTGEIDENVIDSFVNLYLDQTYYPPQMLRQILHYQQQQQSSWMQQDPYILTGDLALFYSRTAQDWFGPKFLELVAQFIHNSALYAKKAGYVVSLSEARASMYEGAARMIREMFPNQEVSPNDLNAYFNQQLRSLGMDEKNALLTWQKVLLFRRLFDDVGQSVFLDKMMHDKLNDFSSDGADIMIYKLPEALRLSSFRDLMKLQVYLDGVKDSSETDVLELPSRFSSIEKIEKKRPELLQRRYLVKMAQITKSEVASELSIKRTWNWEVEDANWKLLCEKFSELRSKKNVEEGKRHTVLSELPAKTRVQIDDFARSQIVNGHPEWIRESLSAVKAKQQELVVSMKEEIEPLAGVKAGRRLMQLLDTALLKNGDDASREAVEKVSFFTGDEEHYYRLQLIDSTKEVEILSFEEANRSGILDHMLDAHLEKKYIEARSLNPRLFQDKNENWLPLKDVETEVGEICFSKLLKAIDREAKNLGLVSPTKVDREERFDLYAKYRLISHMCQMKEKLQEDGALVQVPKAQPEKVRSLSEPVDLEKQWLLVNEKRRVVRKDDAEMFESEITHLADKDWSQIWIKETEGLLFYKVLSRVIEKEPVAKGVESGRRMLANEAKRYFMSDLIKQFSDAGAISLSKNLETEEEAKEV